MTCDRLCNIGTEFRAIYGKCSARRNSGRIRRLHNERTETPHLLLENADSVLKARTAQRVAAHKLGKAVCLMRGGAAQGTHLIERDLCPRLGCLPRSLTSCKPRANDCDFLHASVLLRRVVFFRTVLCCSSADVSVSFDACARDFWRASSFSMGLPIREEHASLLQ